ncbi:GNAT family N-acetyltransferase [Paludibacterium sp. B53371]|uniref:GNAT family N-acetyltransferase n=1 Tax=Paludibacterium sp. B53371 TaxID=2806263 RepID=UPI001C047EE6|nr:GNAT family N-acetyltransferase [Paludibacterium sp. B53371]
MTSDTLLFPEALFCHEIPALGHFSLRAIDLAQDLERLHGWLSSPHAAFWGMQHDSLTQVQDYFLRQAASPHHSVLLGEYQGSPAFLLETYDPRHDPVGHHYQVMPGDRGMHFLCAPPGPARLHGFTRGVMRTIQAWLFSDPAVQRIVVEPAIANTRIHPINLGAGFVYQRQIDLPGKRAWLAFCHRTDYDALQELR